MLWRFLLFIDEMQSFLLNVAVHLLNPPAASLVITTTSSGGHFYYCIIIATPCGGHSTSILSLQPTLAAILLLPHPFNLCRLWPSRLLIYHYLANITLLHHHCNLLWRFCYFNIVFATYSGGHPTSIASFQPMPTLTIPATSISLLQPLLANILLPYHHCNLIWRSSYFNIVFATYSGGSAASTSHLHHQLIGRRNFVLHCYIVYRSSPAVLTV
jgi:hypothetical protein